MANGNPTRVVECLQQKTPEALEKICLFLVGEPGFSHLIPAVVEVFVNNRTPGAHALLRLLGKAPNLSPNIFIDLANTASGLQLHDYISLIAGLSLAISTGGEFCRQARAGVTSDGAPYSAARLWATCVVEAGAASTAAELSAVLALQPQGKYALLLLLAFQAPTPEMEALLEPYDAEICKLLAKEIEQHPESSDAWLALGKTAIWSASAWELVRKFAETTTEVGRAGLVTWLVSVRTEAIERLGTDEVRTLYLRLVKNAVSEPRIRENLDNGVLRMLNEERTRSVGRAVVASVARFEVAPQAIFRHTIDSLPQIEGMLPSVFTEWLLADDVSLTALQHFIQHFIAPHGIAPLEVEQLSNANERMVLRCSKRLKAFVFNSECLAKFVEIFAENPHVGAYGLVVAEELLTFLVEQYPLATATLLKTRSESDKWPPGTFELYGLARAAQKKRDSALDQLSAGNEFVPSEADQLTLGEMKAAESQAIMESLRKQSVFASIVTPVHVAQGRRFGTPRHDQTIETTVMQTRGVSIELPIGHAADPAGYEIYRLQLERESR